MGWFDAFTGGNDLQGASDDYQSGNFHPSVVHEAVGGFAAFEAMKMYEKHCEQNGHPQSHKLAKELLAGFVGSIVEREGEKAMMSVEQKRLAKRHAVDQMGGRIGHEDIREEVVIEEDYRPPQDYGPPQGHHHHRRNPDDY